MEQNRCMGCMRVRWANEDVCPECGHRHYDDVQPPYALPCNSILHGKYLIGKVLDQDQLQITYLAFDQTRNLRVAVRECFPQGLASRDSGQSSCVVWSGSCADAASREADYDRFWAEARKLAQIHPSPTVAQVLDIFPDHQTAYIVTDFVAGETLRSKVMRDGPLPFSDCVKLLTPVMQALDQLHQQGIIHRDIGPDSIVIQPDGVVRLLGLGVSREFHLSPAHTAQYGQQTQPADKGAFRPLEQCVDTGTIGPWTDVYALCATLYYCVTGTLLPPAMDRTLSEKLTFPDACKKPLPPKAKATLSKGLALKPEQRFQTVGALLRVCAKQCKLPNPAKDPAKERTEDRKQKRPKNKRPLSFPKFFLRRTGNRKNRQPVPQRSPREALTALVRSKWFLGILGGLLLLGGIAGIFAWQDWRHCGENLTWSLSDGVLTIQGTGPMESYSRWSNGPGWRRHSEGITSVVLPDGLTRVGSYAFSELSSLRTLALPDSVTAIEDGAFLGCERLSSISFPDDLETIGDSAFQDCTALDDVTLPSEITILPNKVFLGCESLSSIVIPDSVTSLGYSAFESCDSLTSVTLSSNLTRIGSGAFSFCTSLERIDIPPSVTEIEDEAFSSCVSLEEITFWGDAPQFEQDEDGDSRIFSDVIATAYYPRGNDTWSLKTRKNYGGGLVWTLLPIGAATETQETSEAVSEAEPEETAQPEEPEGISWKITGSQLRITGEGAMDDYSSENPPPWWEEHDQITSVVISQRITHIGDAAFQNCDTLLTATIPDSVTSIGAGAFENCTGLQAIQLPDGLRSIGTDAFDDCQGLESVVFPASLDSLGKWAFWDCENLSEITFLGECPELSGSVFYDVSAVVYYPGTNSTWTEAAKEDYGGDLTWVPLGSEPPADTAEDPYILPTDTQRIRESDLYFLTQEEVALARNEIYARHGHVFTNETYAEYFEAQSWYEPDPTFDALDKSQLTAIERYNVDLIVAYEERMGWR